ILSNRSEWTFYFSKVFNLILQSTKNIIYSSSVKYNDLIECAYIGGRNYENLILSNVDFIKIIKDEEKDISEEKSWKERMKDWFKSMFKR
ncbi:hypothetical protein, partial [Lactobacillus paragasseri]|nr:hypothetical protein [Lactobacillus paragasseri]